ncbi:hypothetical protein [Vulcanisaeta sp. JCM 14467]|nr:hypothetical protein [Vulcanisaeta sp. JCM 14467]
MEDRVRRHAKLTISMYEKGLRLPGGVMRFRSARSSIRPWRRA